MLWSKAKKVFPFGSCVRSSSIFLPVFFGFIVSISLPAHGSTGGACPTGANYGNAFNQTLSQIGVNSCFYVSKSTGSDSNSGTSESSPFAHLPGMQTSCTGNCASNTPTAGVGYILRGGDRWTNSDLGIYWPYGGTSSNPSYIGFDAGWFNSTQCGSSWCRPIWDCQGQVCADVAANGNMNIIYINADYTIIDNIEMTGLHTTGGKTFNYVFQGGIVQRSYMHGWSHDPTGDFDASNVMGSSYSVNSCFHDDVIDGSDTTEDMMVALISSIPCAYNDYIAYVTNGMEAVGHNIHDNYFGPIMVPFSGITHQNHLFHFGPDNGVTSEFIYNNVMTITNLGSASGGAVSLWLNGNEGSNATVYAFNNVVYNVGPGNDLNTSGHNSINYGTYQLFNNTFQCGNDSNSNGCDSGTQPSGPVGAYYANNNHWINGNGSTPIYCYTTYSPCSITTNLVQSLSTANGQGYNDTTDPFAFSPASGCTPATCSTVQAGTNLTSLCSTIAGLGTPEATAAATACQLDTTFAVTENTTNHTVSLARTPNPRPLSGPWDIGAYEYGTSDPPPNPPTGLTAVVN
jgi:hypothetical protein